MVRAFDDDIPAGGRVWETGKLSLESLGSVCGEDIDLATVVAATFRGDAEFRAQVMASAVDIFTRQRWPMLFEEVSLPWGAHPLSELENRLKSLGWDIEYQITRRSDKALLPIRDLPTPVGVWRIKIVRLNEALRRNEARQRWVSATYHDLLLYCLHTGESLRGQIKGNELFALGTDQEFENTPLGEGLCPVIDQHGQIRPRASQALPIGTFLLVKVLVG